MSKKTKVEIEADLLPMTQWEIKLVVTMTEGGNSLIDLMDNQGKKSKPDFCIAFSNILWSCKDIVSLKVKESEPQHKNQHPKGAKP